MIRPGDIFLIKTSIGNSYLHYINDTPNMSSLCRVIYKLESEDNIETQIECIKENFSIHFPIKSALKKRIIFLKGNAPLPKNFQEPLKFRTIEVRNNQKLLHLVDRYTWKRNQVDTFSNNDLELNPWGIWNDSLLIERIENDWQLVEWN